MCSPFSTSAQCQIHCFYTYQLLFAGATQGELPEGQEKVPWGITVLRNSFARCYGRHLRIVSDVRLYRRVRRLGAPYQTTCTRVTVGAVIGRPRNRKSSRQFSILHFPFSIIQPHKKRADPSGQPFSLSCCFVCRYLMMFSHQRCMIAAISARVAVPVGARRPPFLPFSTPALTAHCRAGIAYSLAC